MKRSPASPGEKEPLLTDWKKKKRTLVRLGKETDAGSFGNAASADETTERKTAVHEVSKMKPSMSKAEKATEEIHEKALKNGREK